MGWGFSWSELGKNLAVGVGGFVGAAIGSVVPGAGTMIGGAIGAALVGGIWTGVDTGSWGEAFKAAAFDGALGFAGVGLAGNAVRSMIAGPAVRPLFTAITGGIGAAIMSGFTGSSNHEKQKIPKVLPTRPAGQEYRGSDPSTMRYVDSSESTTQDSSKSTKTPESMAT
ncbi:hypothetical protein [Nocardia nepalensis]|uniref:hypothetical protein n=1 Tax=Nocardia nepalensis TaxID=3375448 RepID=UPI003B67CBCC